MSLVEQALKKLQATRSASGPEPVRPHVPVPANQVQPPPMPRTPVDPSRVVVINRERLRAAGILPPQSDERRIAQDYRQIKRPLVDNALGRGTAAIPDGRLIMVASALPGDGKTFSSMNLALSLALEKDLQAVLVDADVAKPHISRLLGVESEPGLLDALRDETLDIESLILPTDVPGLSILPAGRASETATELLASSRMQSLVGRIGASSLQRLVLFDSPPLLLTTESRALTAAVGQVVLVVGAGSTPQRAVLDAIEMIGEGRSISLILNQCDENARNDYYQKFYGTSAPSAETK
jgi:exopolysaccharide/PEP-CTERM locus tyrosine autokinase